MDLGISGNRQLTHEIFTLTNFLYYYYFARKIII